MRFMGELGQGRDIMLCILKSGWWKQAQYAVKVVILYVVVTKAICSFGLVGNCMSLPVPKYVYLCLSFLMLIVYTSANNKYGHRTSFTGALGGLKIVYLAVHQIRPWSMGYSHRGSSRIGQVIFKIWTSKHICRFLSVFIMTLLYFSGGPPAPSLQF